MTKIAGSGSISQCHESADPDPDPHQNVMDPEHCCRLFLGLGSPVWRSTRKYIDILKNSNYIQTDRFLNFWSPKSHDLKKFCFWIEIKCLLSHLGRYDDGAVPLQSGIRAHVL